MKYMHFKASCSYTALAELMEAKGVQTEDFAIALEMQLPWLFAKEEDAYLAGPMLQGAKWFDLWLNPKGYRLSEVSVASEDLCAYLRNRHPVMLGMQTPYGRHAVVCTGYDGQYRFFNPTYEDSGESTELILSEAELISRVDPSVIVGEVIPCAQRRHRMEPLLQASISVLRENCAEIERFASEVHAPDAYLPALNRLFRPLLLDGISMLELANETTLAQAFLDLQQALMGFMRGPRSNALCKSFSLDNLRDLTEAYIRLIRKNGRFAD